MPARHAGRSFRLLFAFLCIAFLLAGCAGLGQDPLRVSVAGIEPLTGEGLEMRFNLKLRVQNPNNSPVDFSGVSLQLDLNGQSFASGVSDQSGTVPRFGETVISVPLTVSALSAVRQAFAFAGSTEGGGIPYKVQGKLGGGFGAARFVDQGKLSLPTGTSPGL
jgi:LEA14-like dessication related protein